jgi:hypothetical protein
MGCHSDFTLGFPIVIAELIYGAHLCTFRGTDCRESNRDVSVGCEALASEGPCVNSRVASVTNCSLSIETMAMPAKSQWPDFENNPHPKQTDI